MISFRTTSLSSGLSPPYFQALALRPFHIYLLNKKLRRYGLAVHANKGAGALYRLSETKAGDDDGYDAADDVNKSVVEGFTAIRARKAAGGAGWGGA